MNWHQFFDYDGKLLFWKMRPANAVRIGDIAGCKDDRGYLRVKISGKHYRVHRIVYEMHHGSIPDDMQIDHVNGIGDDNRIENLRLATIGQNKRNCKKYRSNTSGFTGVTWDKRSQKWMAQIQVNGKNKCLGYFDSPESAYQARLASEPKYHGEFSQHKSRQGVL